MSEQLEQIALEWVSCFYCKAGYQEWCVTRNGRIALHLHACRIAPLQMAYGAGYQDADYDYRRQSA